MLTLWREGRVLISHVGNASDEGIGICDEYGSAKL